jgi:hypothetical protein
LLVAGSGVVSFRRVFLRVVLASYQQIAHRGQCMLAIIATGTRHELFQSGKFVTILLLPQFM